MSDQLATAESVYQNRQSAVVIVRRTATKAYRAALTTWYNSSTV